MNSDSMDNVFGALAHSARRRILDILQESPGCSVNDVCRHFETSRIAVMKHLRVLEEAQLIVSKKHGRLRALYFNLAPIQLIYDRWTTEYSSFWASKVVDLKHALESSIAEDDETVEDAAQPKREREPVSKAKSKTHP